MSTTLLADELFVITEMIVANATPLRGQYVSGQPYR
jgi:hypothetical protein